MTIIILLYSGELPERVLYHALQAYFCEKNESVAVFHGIDILKLNLEKFKITEKDFVIINSNRRCIIVIEVKKTLGAGNSVEKSFQQLKEAKEDFEAWFGTEELHKWIFIPMIFTEEIQQNITCIECLKYIIEGKKIFLLNSKTKYKKLRQMRERNKSDS